PEIGIHQRAFIQYLCQTQIKRPVFFRAMQNFRTTATLDLTIKYTARQIRQNIMIKNRRDVAVRESHSPFQGSQLLVEIKLSVNVTVTRFEVGFQRKSPANVNNRLIPLITQTEIGLIARFRRSSGKYFYRSVVDYLLTGSGIRPERVKVPIQ